MQTVTLTLQEVRDLVTPALNICWALRLELQDHPCKYQEVAIIGGNNLAKLLTLAQERATNETDAKFHA